MLLFFFQKIYDLADMLWKELARVALLGTDRITLSDNIEAQLAAHGIDTEHLSSAEQLLEGAALLGLIRKTNCLQLASQASNQTPILDTTTNYLRAKACRYLAEILQKHPTALLEFSRIAAEYNQLIPPEYLPQLFDWSTEDRSVWNAIAPMIGERGWWLITQNPAWQDLEKQAYHHTVPDNIQEARESLQFVRSLQQSLGTNPLLLSADHRNHLQQAAYYCDLSYYIELKEGWQVQSYYGTIWHSEIERFLKIIMFRKGMQEALEV